MKHSSSSQSSLPFLEKTESGLYLNIRVQPKAGKNELLLSETKDVLKVKLTSAPVDGEANKALIKLLAKFLKIKKSSITITSGKKSRNKRVRIEEIKLEECLTLLDITECLR